MSALNRIRGHANRPLQVAERNRQNAYPLGRAMLSKDKSDDRMRQLVTMAAHGQVDLDQNAADVISRVLDKDIAQLKQQQPQLEQIFGDVQAGRVPPSQPDPNGLQPSS